MFSLHNIFHVCNYTCNDVIICVTFISLTSSLKAGTKTDLFIPVFLALTTVHGICSKNICWIKVEIFPEDHPSKPGMLSSAIIHQLLTKTPRVTIRQCSSWRWGVWGVQELLSQTWPSPFKMSNLLSLLHWDTEELSRNDLCLPNGREFLDQSGEIPASPTFSPFLWGEILENHFRNWGGKVNEDKKDPFPAIPGLLVSRH